MKLRPLAAAQVALIGVLIAAVPQHTESLLRLGLVSVAAGAAVVLLQRTLTTYKVEPDATSPLDRHAPPAVSALDPPGLTAARQAVTGATVVRADTPPLSPEAWHRVVVTALVTLHSRGIDIDNPRTRDAARRLLSDGAWRTITAPVPHRMTSDVPMRPAECGDVAATVNTLLDELERLGGSS